ncbi:MAG TPA: methyltransferase domain-containing protein [Verrucomicrobiae bacterium]|nr:methyltransferase domain-containing protein [Verrucomicrobiae bacterium]
MAFQALSRIPGGHSIYYAAQRNLTNSTTQTAERLQGKIEQTLMYWNWLSSNTPPGWLAEATHLDLGSGWLPSVPMSFHALGVKKQYLVDITQHMKPEAVVETAEIFRTVAPKMPVKFARLPVVPPKGLSLQKTLEPLGMIYAAPYDELANEIQNTVGFATATHMLHHMNRTTMPLLLKTVHRLLKPGGYFLAQQHLRQLFDGLESKTSPFFSLRYSDETWEKWINSPMMSYNRLKERDYREILESAGFEVAAAIVEPGRPEDFALLDQAEIHPIFKRYSREELAARHIFLVGRKPS